MRPFGSATELENRRRLAVTRVLDGYTQAEVARFLGVHVRTVRRWVADHRHHGDEGLAAKPQPGPTPKLSPEQERIVLSWFRKCPTEFGFPTELWTAPRVARLIERTFGVKFHPRHLNAWLTARDITPRSRSDGPASGTKTRSTAGSRRIGPASRRRPARRTLTSS